MDPWMRFGLVSLALVNLASFAAFGFDKHRARAGGRRIPERTLHLLGLLGGFPAGFLAMQVFRHKRRKPSFVLTYVLAAAVSAAVLLWIADRFLPNVRNFP